MDNHRLRSILLNLQYRLSDNDRERLHFYLKNDVPRPVGDDSTLSGTLKLMQSLFDQEKISEKDFTLLIDAFKQIRCFDAVQLLKEHQHRMLLSGLNQSTQSFASMMPSLVEEYLNDNEDDPYHTDNLILEEINSNNRIIDGYNINMNPIDMTYQDTEKISSTQKQSFCQFSSTNKYFLLIFLLFISTLGILIIVLIVGIKRINSLESNIQIKRNDAVVHFVPKEKEIIEQLNKTLIEINNERSTILIKAGRKFGGDGGGDFDDSLLTKFTSSHYLSGFIFSDIDRFDSCQFIYTSSDNKRTRRESSFHGGNGKKINSTYKYYLDNDERIERVHVKSFHVLFISNNGHRHTTKVIRGLKFVTTKDRTIPPGIQLTGDDVEFEYFPGYTLGYVTGKSGFTIDQLQFFWYRTDN